MREENKYPLDITCADVFTIALLIGARPGEFLAKKEGLEWKTGELSIKRTGAYEDGRTKTMNSIRILTPPVAAATILHRRCEGINADDLIFQEQIKCIITV